MTRWTRALGCIALPIATCTWGCNSLFDIQSFPDDGGDADASRDAGGERVQDGSSRNADDASTARDSGQDAHRADGDPTEDSSSKEPPPEDGGASSRGDELSEAASDSMAYDATAGDGASDARLDATFDDGASDPAAGDGASDAEPDAPVDGGASDSSGGDARAVGCMSPSAANIIDNPGFDTGIEGWTASSPGLTITFANEDSTDCPSSGSILLAGEAINSTFTQCVPITAGQTYNAGVWIRTPSGGPNGHTYLQIDWSSDAHCGAPITNAAEVFASGTLDTWELLSQDGLVAPPGTLSATVAGQIVVASSQVYESYFDRFYLSLFPAHF